MSSGPGSSNNVAMDPGNAYNVLPPLGMARNLAQANEWAAVHGMTMNGLVPVPHTVFDEDGSKMPATNNGQINPYTAVQSVYRREWKGEGAHPAG